MFDAIINTIAQQFGLGEKAKPFVQMLLATMSDPANGGLTGFVQRLRAGGIGSMVDDWIARPAEAAPVASPAVERALGDEDMVSAMTSKLGIDRGTIVKALGFAVPALVSRIAQGGSLPSALPTEAENFLGNRKIWLASAASNAPLAAAAVAPSRGWLPLVLVAVVAAILLGYCATRKVPQPVVSTPPPAVATTPAPDVAVEEPTGAAIMGLMLNGAPSMKVYFDTGKADVSAEFSGKAKDLADYLKANAAAMAVISGFNDPTGDPVANAALSKKRAMAVQDALVAAGVPINKTVLEKPADTTGTGVTNAASRRADIVVRK